MALPFRRKAVSTDTLPVPEQLPKHIGFIMDGNGRWATKRGMPRKFGHREGAKTFHDLTRYCRSIGIQNISFYVFSTENWKRPEKEVKALMKLLRKYLKDCIERTAKNNMRVRVIGEKSRLDDDIRAAIDELEEVSAANTGLNFTIALNYGSRDEMVRAMRHMAQDCKDGAFDPEEITEEKFASYLDTKDLPDPDLMIRTSGEQRLSNWMLWQLAYAEFYFTDVLWPDFDKEELIRAVEYYNTRDRRFGGV